MELVIPFFVKTLWVWIPVFGVMVGEWIYEELHRD